jgi:DNA repair protein RecO (recombination protein O)
VSQDIISGFLLHRRPYRETSYLLDVFTLELGKISLVAKGVRGSKSDKKSLLQSFQPLLLSVYGKHELKNLRQVEAKGPALVLTGNNLFSAMYLNEVLNRVLAIEQAHNELFELYESSLTALSQQQEIEPVLREFELGLLNELGYGLDFNNEWQGGQTIEPGLYYTLVLEHGFQQLPGSDRSSNCFLGENLKKISHYQWDKGSLNSAKRISRMALAPLLGQKPLKSRELFAAR